MVEVKVHRVLPVAMDTTLTLVVADIMVIMVSPMVMMVAIQMTHTVHFQKVPHLSEPDQRCRQDRQDRHALQIQFQKV